MPSNFGIVPQREVDLEGRTVVLVSGRFMSGKSTLATHLEGQMGFVRASLADELKQDLCELACVSREYLDTNKGLFRTMMQEYGELMRHIHGPDYWVKRLREVMARYPSHVNFVVDDVRYPNELLGFPDCRTLTVRLDISPGEQALRYHRRFGVYPSDEQMRHNSEVALDPDLYMWDVRLSTAVYMPSSVYHQVASALMQRNMVMVHEAA